ncbi:glutathione S-transferase [Pseudomonas sp. StFLB209]|uniref:glutathione S-transferase family protein n=1 Tax=Pseudomonas sp. StFLB209 TaxID=1028989 RepID=UPI0004F705D3|nr:glutathione S-transferase [Pseudomonas sp. StFLB209]BAP45665.1 glutathione S-transferase [Pseudomonas sp. StFLB209]
MSEFKLHCFALSGNAYKVALFLALSRQTWQPVFVDFLNGQTRTRQWRDTVNEQGEVPVLEHQGKSLTQSALILDYLADYTGQFGGRTAEEKQEIWRWMLFDNHKFTSYYATLRFLYGIQKTGDTEVTRFLRDRAAAAYQVVDTHLSKTPWLVGERMTIADLSLAGYVFMPEETGLSMEAYPHIQAWKKRIQELPGWQHPYELMPGPTGL